MGTLSRIGCLAATILVVAAPTQAQEFGWSPGILFTANVLGPTETTDLIDANGIVQTTAVETSQVRPAFEAHVAAGWTHLRVGPFIGVEMGDQLIRSVGAGVMFSIMGRLNLGVGYWVAPQSQVRRADFIPGQPAPAGYTEVAYVERATTALAIMAGVPLP